MNIYGRTYLENLADEMRCAGQENWKSNDMQDLCELADLWGEWLETTTRQEEEELSLKAAKALGVEIRHYVKNSK